MNRDRWTCALFLLLVPLAHHLAFSWMGFIPIDDFILPCARRLARGEVPHRDFVFHAPVLSPLLHVPETLLGGERLLRASRLMVWFQFACIAWSWAAIAARAARPAPSPAEKLLWALGAFALTSHLQPLMAWYTVDGFLLSSLGLALVLREGRGRKAAGYLLLGMAALCKQSFLAMAPAALLASGDWRRPAPWLWASLPAAAYLLLLATTGALADAALQLRPPPGSAALGLRPYLGAWTLSGALGGWFCLRAAGGSSAPQWAPYGLALAAAAAMSGGAERYHTLSLALFGALLGAIAALPADSAGLRRAGLLALAAAWSASLSVGYNSPALAAGALAVLLVACGRAAGGPRPGRFHAPAAAALAVAALAGHAAARRAHVYRDAPARELHCPLDGVFPGAAGIRTGADTCRRLLDLRAAVRAAGGSEYAIVPGFPSYWAGSPRANPLPMDWLGRWGLSQRAARERVVAALEARRGRIVVLVEAGSESHPLSRHVRENFRRSARSGSFDLYR